MSKTKQRKQSLYFDGLKDGKAGKLPKWKRTQASKPYYQGYRIGKTRRTSIPIGRWT